jgi:hypothetical protein
MRGGSISIAFYIDRGSERTSGWGPEEEDGQLFYLTCV